MRKSQSRHELAFHRKSKGPGAGMNLACHRTSKAAEQLEEGGVKAGRGDRVRKEFGFYPMCKSEF